MFINICTGAFNDLCVGRGRARVRLDMEQLIQYAGNCLGKLAFLYWFWVAEEIQNPVHFLENRETVNGRDNISMWWRNQLVIASGENAVKMKPGNFSTWFESIFVGNITVDEDKLSLGGLLELLMGKPDLAGSLGNIHQKKAVISNAGAPVSGLVIKEAGFFGIKVDSGSRCAGLIYIIIRFWKDKGFFCKHVKGTSWEQFF